MSESNNETCPNCGFSSDLSPRGQKRLERRIDALEAALKDMFLLIDEHKLVRNIDNDDDPLWALHQLDFVRRLAANQKPIGEPG